MKVFCIYCKLELVEKSEDSDLENQYHISCLDEFSNFKYESVDDYILKFTYIKCKVEGIKNGKIADHHLRSFRNKMDFIEPIILMVRVNDLRSKHDKKLITFIILSKKAFADIKQRITKEENETFIYLEINDRIRFNKWNWIVPDLTLDEMFG